MPVCPSSSTRPPSTASSKNGLREKYPGGALAVVQDGEIVYKKGYGLADIEHQLPIEPSSVFYIGSVSKQFVTFCILLLEEQGKLSLDDSIQTFLPDFPTYGHTLTLRHFIHHTSGVRDFITLMDLKGRSYLDHMEVEEVYDLIKRQKELNFVPGDQYLYSNSCYFMLALIVEKASGKPIREFAHEEIFEPLGMEHTQFYDNNRNFVYNKAFSYEPSSKGFDNLIMRFDLVGSGGIYSTVEDLYLWDQNFYDNKLGKGTQALIDKMHEEGMLNNGKSSGYAFALNNGIYKGLRTVSHSGALAGYRAQLLRFPDQQFSVIILSNRGDGNPTQKAYQVADIWLQDLFKVGPSDEGKEPFPPAGTLSINDTDRNVFTGTYRMQAGVELTVAEIGDSLKITQEWNGETAVLQQADDFSFTLSEDTTMRLAFAGTTGGKAQSFFIYQQGNLSEWKRREKEVSPETQLGEFVGTYYAEELDITYTLSLIDEKLAYSLGWQKPVALREIDLDTFFGNGIQFRFVREGEKISGFKLDAGRVQNLAFERR